MNELSQISRVKMCLKLIFDTDEFDKLGELDKSDNMQLIFDYLNVKPDAPDCPAVLG